MNVLLADDHALVRDALAQGLRDTGAEVVDAPDVETVLARLSDTAIAVIVVDLGMLGRDVSHFLDAFAARAPRVPQILMTGDAVLAAKVGAERPAAGEVLVKPFRVEALRRAIERAAS